MVTCRGADYCSPTSKSNSNLEWGSHNRGRPILLYYRKRWIYYLNQKSDLTILILCIIIIKVTIQIKKMFLGGVP